MKERKERPKCYFYDFIFISLIIGDGTIFLYLLTKLFNSPIVCSCHPLIIWGGRIIELYRLFSHQTYYYLCLLCLAKWLSSFLCNFLLEGSFYLYIILSCILSSQLVFQSFNLKMLLYVEFMHIVNTFYFLGEYIIFNIIMYYFKKKSYH